MKTRVAKVTSIAVHESDPLRAIGLKALLESVKQFDLHSVTPGDLASMVDKDVVLIGERRGMNPVALIEKLRALRKDIRVILVGSAADDEAVLEAMAAGAKGYINESASAAEFAQAIRAVSEGLIWASRRVFSVLIDRVTDIARRQRQPEEITNREKQVLEMLVIGRSNKEIALPMGIEERTVKAHIAKLMRKVGVQNRITLSVHAITHSLVAVK